MTQVEKYDNWMRNTIKSIHYGNNAAMTRAYSKISKSLKKIRKKNE